MLWNLEHLDKKFLMYPRFVQIFLNNHIEGLSTPSEGNLLTETFVSLSHTKKVFSNMRRASKGFSGKDTPLFSTMVGCPTEGGEGSVPQIVKTPTDPQPPPQKAQTISKQPEPPLKIPQSLLTSTPPISKQFSRKKTKRVPPSPVSPPQEPKSPQDEQVSLENPQREPTGMSPHSQEVVYKELDDHLERAATTEVEFIPPQDSGNIDKTQSKATSSTKVSKEPEMHEGPWCQETTKGGDDDQTRSDTFPNISSDPFREGPPPKQGEDRNVTQELKTLCTRLSDALTIQQGQIETLQSSVATLKKTVSRLVHYQKRKRFAKKPSKKSKPETQVEDESSLEPLFRTRSPDKVQVILSSPSPSKDSIKKGEKNVDDEELRKKVIQVKLNVDEIENVAGDDTVKGEPMGVDVIMEYPSFMEGLSEEIKKNIEDMGRKVEETREQKLREKIIKVKLERVDEKLVESVDEDKGEKGSDEELIETIIKVKQAKFDTAKVARDEEDEGEHDVEVEDPNFMESLSKLVKKTVEDVGTSKASSSKVDPQPTVSAPVSAPVFDSVTTPVPTPQEPVATQQESVPITQEAPKAPIASPKPIVPQRPILKGVSIREGANVPEKKEVVKDIGKGKEKMIEPEKKKKIKAGPRQIESDEALARKMQEELDQETAEQMRIDAELAQKLLEEEQQELAKESAKAKPGKRGRVKSIAKRSPVKKKAKPTSEPEPIPEPEPTPEPEPKKRGRVKKMATKAPRSKKSKPTPPSPKPTTEIPEQTAETEMMLKEVQESTATPIGMKLPIIVDWDEEIKGKIHGYKLTRADKSIQSYPNFTKMIRTVSRDDLQEMFEVGKIKYGNLGRTIHTKLVMDYLQMMFDPIDDDASKVFSPVISWTVYDHNGVYCVIKANGRLEFYLVEKKYNHSLAMMQSMMLKGLVSRPGSTLAPELLKKIKVQIQKLEEKSKRQK